MVDWSKPIPAAPIPTEQDLIDIVEVVLFPERPERVRMAASGLSEGIIERLRNFIAEANRDFRNVPYWYEYTRPGVELRFALEERPAERKPR